MTNFHSIYNLHHKCVPILVSPEPQLLIEVLGEQMLDVGSGDFRCGLQHAEVLTDILLGVDAARYNRGSAFYDLRQSTTDVNSCHMPHISSFH